MKSILPISVACGCLVLASAAHADNYKLNGPYFPNAITFKETSNGGSFYSGELSFTDTNSNQNYLTYCDDLAHDISSGNSYGYTIAPNSDALHQGLGNIIAGSQSQVTDAFSSAALQFALWSYQYNGTGAFTDNGPGFTIDTNSFGNLPNGKTGTDLLNLASTFFNHNTTNYGETVYQLTPTGGGQGQIYIQSAPEPMSMGALAVGLVGLIGRRRKRA